MGLPRGFKRQNGNDLRIIAKENDMKNEEYHEKIRTAQTLEELDAIIDNAAFDEEIANYEYCIIYSVALKKADTI